MNSNNKNLIRNVILIVIICISVVGLCISLFLYLKSQGKQTVTPGQSVFSTPTPADPDAAMVEKVSRHMVLPVGNPKVITVSDVETLKRDQPFFSRAQDGDVLLVYPERVILYSPTLDKIVEIAQIREASGAGKK
jgi:hypothetical protein